MTHDPAESREAFALRIVRRLREAGYEALWAGGCVRDLLLNRRPKDYDVATNATPDQVRRCLGHRRTLPIGAAFGVITVIGPKSAGQLDVATFRRDAGYSDGRRPDSVEFSSAEEDAQRRDFTINGLFYDPIDHRVFDYVGGQADLEARIVRAIRDPDERIAEDKLRMLRGVRFAATYQFTLDDATRQAIVRHAASIHQVSAERIAAEMHRMLMHDERAAAAKLLRDCGLADVILPESTLPAADSPQWQSTLDTLDRLESPSFSMSLAALLQFSAAEARQRARRAESVGRMWRLSNADTENAAWLLIHQPLVADAPRQAWSAVQPVLVDARAPELIRLVEAADGALGRQNDAAEWCRRKMEQPRDQWDPKPLLNGDDLRKLGAPAGPIYGQVLRKIRDAQLDQQISSTAEALEMAERMIHRRHKP